MDMYTATEVAYKNGYAAGSKDTAIEIYKLAEQYNKGYELDMDVFMNALKKQFKLNI